MTLTNTLDRRTAVRNEIGRRTPTEIRTLIVARPESEADHLAWLAQVADRLAASGFLTLADVTDEEFDVIVG
jgi:hypothetical protein